MSKIRIKTLFAWILTLENQDISFMEKKRRIVIAIKLLADGVVA